MPDVTNNNSETIIILRKSAIITAIKNATIKNGTVIMKRAKYFSDARAGSIRDDVRPSLVFRSENEIELKIEPVSTNITYIVIRSAEKSDS